ncbi:phosphatase PAP2 family protein [Novosphingobium aquimarinum]|uniref:phosphatase PAP2 family protein n=1 Tax=Novosphingobium aquimarinum TaxID=2682494 RepID=UPI0012EB687C|nr:phosphatase PAP2 family protein [Novosphingobium aquimarinum]
MQAEKEWIYPAIGLTLAMAAAALVFTPNSAGLLSNLVILPSWMLASAVVGSIYALVRMMAMGVKSPLAELGRIVREDRNWLIGMMLMIGLAGANMMAFLWFKPLLNYLVPFRADPFLAQADRWLAFGHDPFSLLDWLDVPGAEFVYHKLWTGMMILTLLVVAARPASADKSAVMLGYFVLWSVVGPLVHILMPAAGPIFYARMGYGDHFAALGPGPETRVMADYLWAVYDSRSFGAGSGISAMPSLHVTTAVWMALAIRVHAPRFFWPMAMFSALLFALSIALGWHYALDGVIGGACAVAVHFGLRAWFRARRMDVNARPAQVTA